MARTPSKWTEDGLIAKMAVPVLTAVTVALLGFFTSQYLSKRQADEARIQLYAQLMSQREQSDSALRKDMFQTIFNSFLKGSAGSLDEQVLNLELLAYNFHESLNLTPLFIYLNKKIVSSGDRNKANLLKRVERVARDVAMKQLLVLEAAGDYADRNVDLEALQRRGAVGIKLEPARLVFGAPKTETEVTVYILAANFNRHELKLRLEYSNPQSATTTRGVEFSVGFYDFPMIDNTRLPGDRRVAVVLNNFDEHSAYITIAGFPGAYASLIEKPYFDDLVNQLIERPGLAERATPSKTQ